MRKITRVGRKICGQQMHGARRLARTLASLILLGAIAGPSYAAAPPAAMPAPCAPTAPGKPTFITEDCTDPRFDKPVIDVDETRREPVRHRYVNGHFEGTDARFSFYFPDPDHYRGRFYQRTHPSFTDENSDPGEIAFALSVGAYLVRTNMNLYALTGAHTIQPGESEAGAYRVNAAAAKFSRVVAARLYDDHRPFGYLYGGSGGSMQTMGSMQNTRGVWDGGIPYIMGTPSALPLYLMQRLRPLHVLKENNRFPAIVDAIDPGGSGDIYAGLNREEREALEEATRMGFPPRGWYNWATMPDGALVTYGLVAIVPAYDPGYVEDFWSKPGYLGTDPAYSTRAARVQHKATVVAVTPGLPTLVKLSSIPDRLATVSAGDLAGFDLILTSGKASGEVIPIDGVRGDTVVVGAGRLPNPAVLNAIQPGDEVRVDNSWFLAYETYQRHQVPGPDEYGFDQYRGADGAPIYPQRKVLVGHKAFNLVSGGGVTGDFNGKVIVVQGLMDVHAFPWNADWYRTRVMKAKGRQYGDSYRLYYIDHAQHVPEPGPAAAARTVLIRPAVRQALLELSAWVEQGVEPPQSTRYRVVDSQVLVPAAAKERLGIQPVVHLSANGRERADIAAGDTVTFDARIEMPPGAGRLVAAEWDFLGAGDYPDPAVLDSTPTSVSLKASHTYTIPGTYFPVLRATAHRNGDARDPYHRVQNLARVRVVVE